MLSIFGSLFYFDMLALKRKQALWLQPILFFVVVLALFGITGQVSPAIIWVTFLLTSLLSVDSLLRSEHEEGVLEQWVVSDYPLWWLLISKSWALWLASCLPLITLTPLAGLFLHLSSHDILVLMVTLLLGSPALSFIGLLGACLTVALPRAGLLLALLLLPLYLPVLILGESALLQQNGWPVFQMLMLLAFSILSITLAPHAASLALKASMDES